MIINVFSLHEGGLSTNLSTNLIVGQSVRREQRDLLSSSNGVHHVDRRDTRLDHLLRVNSLIGVDGHTLDVQEVLSQDGWSVVNRHSRSIEGTTQHLVGDGHLEGGACELAMGVEVVDARGTLEDLDHCTFSLDFEDLALAGGAVGETHVDDLGVLGELDVVQDHQGSVDLDDCAVVHSRSDVVISSSS